MSFYECGQGIGKFVHRNSKRFYQTFHPSCLWVSDMAVQTQYPESDSQGQIEIGFDSNKISRAVAFGTANRESGCCPSRAIG
jgi:hypothetical protein